MQSQLQDHLAQMRGRHCPLPLTDDEANEQAMRLRRRGMTYTGIALAMSEYHGYWLTAPGWLHRLRNFGAPRTKGPMKGTPGGRR